LDFLFMVGPQSEFVVVTVGHDLSVRGGSLPFTTAWFLVIDG